MCGIAGWVDFKTDLRDERATAEAMTATMALRGPDDGGVWLSPQAAIGHRRLAVIDIEGGVQPMVDDEVVLTYSGEVYNYKELRDELISDGHTFRTESDTEVVLRAYQEWGTACIERLNGMFAFAIWDGRAEELLLVRDRLGVKPLFYYPLPGGILFGSEPKAILANPLAKRRVDTRGICVALSQLRTPGQTAFQGLLELQPGHYLKFSKSGTSVRKYWELEARPHEDDLPTTVAKIRELLEDTVARQMVADVPLCMLLSGGIDSSALVALAQQSKGEGEELRTFAVDFTADPEHLDSDEMGLYNAVDRPFAEEVARHVGTVHESIVLESEALLDPEARQAVLRAMDSSHHLVDGDISLNLLFRAIREHSTVAVSGEAADEVFGGYPWMHNQAVLDVPLFPWAVAVMQGGQDSSSLIDLELAQRLGMFEYLFGQYNESLAEVPHLDDEDEKEHRMREVMHQHLTRMLPSLLDRKDRMSMETGLEVRVPFCDHRLVEYVFNTPWSMKTFDGREKSLLREATRDLLPDSVLERQKSGYPITPDPRYDQSLRTTLKRIIEDPNEPIQPFLGGEEARAVLREEWSGISFGRRSRLESALRLNMWLKEYDVELIDVV
jgi:asparagine synthase (glutamine-hydrolysing)